MKIKKKDIQNVVKTCHLRTTEWKNISKPQAPEAWLPSPPPLLFSKLHKVQFFIQKGYRSASGN